MNEEEEPMQKTPPKVSSGRSSVTSSGDENDSRRDQEIRDLKELVEDLRVANKDLELMFSDDSEELMELRDKKLVELAKKNKNMMVRLNKEKSKVAVLTQQLQKLQIVAPTPVTNNNNLRHFSSKKDSQLNETMSTSDAGEDEGEDESSKLLKQFKDRAASYEKRMKLLREQGEKYKSENLKLRGIIQKEVGDEVTIDSLLNNTDGFRGRAQQIYLLKIKVKDLQKKLELLSSPNSSLQLNSTVNTTSGIASPTNVNTTVELSSISTLSTASVDERQKKTLDKLGQEKKTEVHELKKEIAEKAEEIKSIQNKLEASTARCKILEKNFSEMRTKQARILEKCENDNKLITLLKSEVENLKKKTPAKTSSASNLSVPQEQEIKKLNKELEQRDETIKNLKTELQIASKKILEAVHNQSEFTTFNLTQASDEELKLKLTISNIELEKLKELKKLQANKIVELEQKLCDTSELLTKERLLTADLERKCHQFFKGEKQHPAFDQPSPVLQEEVMLLRDETEALKQTIEHSKKKKEEEIRTYQEIIDSQKRNFETYITILKDKLRDAGVDCPTPQTTRSQSQEKPKEDVTETKEDHQKLVDENETLRKELAEIKSLYNTMAFSQQQKKKFTLNKQ